LLDDSALEEKWWPLIAITDENERAHWFAKAVQLTLGQSIDFWRRMVVPSKAFPLVIFWLIFNLPDVRDENRKRLASDLIDQIANLPSTVYKIVCIFYAEFVEMRSTGVCCIALWRLVYDIARMWKLDTQDVEGLNSILKHICKICPHIGWELLAARLATRNRMGNATAARQDELVLECVALHEEAMAILQDSKRYALITLPEGDEEAGVEQPNHQPAVGADNELMCDAAAGRPTGDGEAAQDAAAIRAPDMAGDAGAAGAEGLGGGGAGPNAYDAKVQRCVAKHVLRLKKLMKENGVSWTEPDATFAFRLELVGDLELVELKAEDPMHGTLWLPGHCFRSNLWLVKCEDFVGPEDNSAVKMVVPLKPRPLFDLLLHRHAKLKD
jgi:hypothetical protein